MTCGRGSGEAAVIAGVVLAAAAGCASRDLTIGISNGDGGPPPDGRVYQGLDAPGTPQDAGPEVYVHQCFKQSTGRQLTLGVDACGPACDSCSTSLSVPGGTFYRSYDAILYADQGYPATVSAFALDKYEVTVGRFRQFVTSVVAGWRPAPGSGKHTHLNEGRGLADSSAPGAFESGWDPAWTGYLGTTSALWDRALLCQTYGGPNWTSTPSGEGEQLPINCLNWYQAYAFCIWDGGFLPSEAEWNYAAAGGEQRAFPWSNPPTAYTTCCGYANCAPGPNMCVSPVAPGEPATHISHYVGDHSPNGDGRWGHADLAGNVAEWTMDWFVPYSSLCVDCAYLASSLSAGVALRVQRGGSYATPAFATGQPSMQGTSTDPAVGASALASERIGNDPAMIHAVFGVRCAHAPAPPIPP